VVYIEKTTIFCNERANWVPKMILFCKDFMNFDWPKCNRTVNIPQRYINVKDRVLGKTHYPLYRYHREGDDFNLIKHLVDFIYCIEFGIAIEKTWSFEFPTKFDYLAPPKISKKKNTTELATMTETEKSKDVVVDFAKPSFSTTTSITVELGVYIADTSDEATSMQNSKAVDEQRIVCFLQETMRI